MLQTAVLSDCRLLLLLQAQTLFRSQGSSACTTTECSAQIATQLHSSPSCEELAMCLRCVSAAALSLPACLLCLCSSVYDCGGTARTTTTVVCSAHLALSACNRNCDPTACSPQLCQLHRAAQACLSCRGH